jgi:hypothetical protein
MSEATESENATALNGEANIFETTSFIAIALLKLAMNKIQVGCSGMEDDNKGSTPQLFHLPTPTLWGQPPAAEESLQLYAMYN